MHSILSRQYAVEEAGRFQDAADRINAAIEAIKHAKVIASGKLENDTLDDAEGILSDQRDEIGALHALRMQEIDDDYPLGDEYASERLGHAQMGFSGSIMARRA
jgi:hypothetical protein